MEGNCYVLNERWDFVAAPYFGGEKCNSLDFNRH